MNLEGDIREINLIERLVELWRQQFTGAIRFENDGIIKIIYFKGGDILSASTNDRADSVDEILMRAGKVSRDHVKQALAKRKESETLGDALLNLGFITRKELTWARRVQVIGVIRSIDEWAAGAFTVVADYLPKREEGTIFPLPQILVELIVTDQDRPKFERALESGSVVLEKSPLFDESFGRLGLNEEAEAIVAGVDGQRSASEVASVSGQETFNAYKLLHALTLLGLLQRRSAWENAAVPEAAAVPVPVANDFASDGVADAADAWGSSLPKFDLDDAPALETPFATSVAPILEPPAASEPAPMPVWEAPPRSAVPSFAPAPEPPAEAREEPQWGFDEAQIEASRHATMPPPPSTRSLRKPFEAKKAKPRRSYALLVALMILFILAGADAGWVWWSGREEASGTARVAATPRPAPTAPPLAVPAPAETGTIVETTSSVPTPGVTPPSTARTAATATQSPAPRRTTAAAPSPEIVTLKPAAPAAVQAGSGAALRDRYDAMAREFAASPTGNFTVQFVIVCEPSNVLRALNAGGTNVWFVPVPVKAKGCYRLFWGHFDTREAAERAMREMPSSLRESTPSVVAVPKR